MIFKAQTEDEVLAEQLCPKGKSPFTVLQAELAKSKKGADMLKLKLNIHADDGLDYHVYDYISPAFMAFKFRHFFYAIGRGDTYESGRVDPDTLVGAEGWCDVFHQKGKDGYGPKASISDYTTQSDKASAPSQPAQPASQPKSNEDDVPF